jgi:hypothetical protein
VDLGAPSADIGQCADPLGCFAGDGVAVESGRCEVADAGTAATAEAEYSSLALSAVATAKGDDKRPSLAQLLELEVTRLRLGLSARRRNAAASSVGLTPSDLDPTPLLRMRDVQVHLRVLAAERATATAAPPPRSLSLASLYPWWGPSRTPRRLPAVTGTMCPQGGPEPGLPCTPCQTVFFIMCPVYAYV